MSKTVPLTSKVGGLPGIEESVKPSNGIPKLTADIPRPLLPRMPRRGTFFMAPVPKKQPTWERPEGGGGCHTYI